jgi:hypothetical protein
MGDGMNIVGNDLDERGLRQRTGDIAAVGGLRRFTLHDGVNAGVEVVELRTAAGLVLDILVGRAMDLGRFEYRGIPLAWRSGTGFRHPGLHEYHDEYGLSWLRSFDGLLVSAGLDHTLFTAEVDASNYHYPPRPTSWNGLHGRISNIPARLVRADEIWQDGRCLLVVEGTVTQAAVFGEHLVLRRRIEADLDGLEIRITDTVTNAGFSRTPHMFLYHVNLSWPLVDEGARLVAPISHTEWYTDSVVDQGVSYQQFPPPQPDFVEQVYQHRLVDASGWYHVAVLNERRALGVELSWRSGAFPHFFEWLNLREGAYAVGLEPSTHHVTGAQAARDAGQMIWLDHGESRTYESSVRVLDGDQQLGTVKRRIQAIQIQPEGDIPPMPGGTPAS